MNKKAKIISTILIYIVMMIVATTEGLINMFGVSIRQSFNINDTTFSLMFTFGSIGYLLCNYIGGYLSEKIGQKKLVLIGLIGVILMNLVQWKAPSFLMFGISFAMIQGFLGLISIAINTVIPILWLTGQAIAMNLTHFSYGVGLSASQKISGMLLSDNVSWRYIYLGAAILTLIIFVVFFFVKLPYNKELSKIEKVSLGEVLKEKTTWFLVIGLGFYIMAEQGTGRWLPTYIETNYGYLNKSQIASYVSIFFLLLTLGRLIGGFIVQKFGDLKSVRVFSFLGSVTFISGLLLGEKGLYAISISGFFFSIIFPTSVVIASNSFKKYKAYSTGVVITFASLVNTFLNLLVGVLSDKFGISTAIFVMPISIFITFCFLSMMKRYKKS
ncbi:MFS transporter [Clostridium sp. LY3-2]|uniref:MFS transporter n=1 Tax=Clostridium sp. LY3-2 TaxID=2942482 RepID=UPI002152CB29|nr:MFS transporter [Clostridium sp. LY3-2]MCR6515749.1 MFS transporter [Clostridium sp. LY3-2]